jgi:ATP-dependent Clp protease adapter protein ClpS
MLSGNVTNLDFVEYLLEVGADPNAKTMREDTIDVHHAGSSRCGQISAELAYHGRQYYHSVRRSFRAGLGCSRVLFNKVALH